jgi:tetratricopeptide (TPR) repeat protein
MIRRDYIMRIVQEMAQVLARVIALKNRQEYDQAMREIGAALRQLQDAPSGTTGEPSLDDWIALCHQHGPAASGLMTAIAQLLAEQGEMLARQGREKAAHRADTLALGLTLDTLLSGETFVSAELLDRIDRLTELTWNSLTDGGVWKRLIGYYEARGRYAQAEDALFAWRATGDLASEPAGLAFFARLSALPDDELTRGNLPRAEVEEGRREFEKKRNGPTGPESG